VRLQDLQRMGKRWLTDRGGELTATSDVWFQCMVDYKRTQRTTRSLFCRNQKAEGPVHQLESRHGSIGTNWASHTVYLEKTSPSMTLGYDLSITDGQALSLTVL